MRPFILLIALVLGVAVRAEVTLPAMFSDHMMLQAGVAAPGEEVSVSIASQTKMAKANAQGEWRVRLEPLKAGDTGTMTVKGSNTIVIRDVLAGEVWPASGQSNMHFNSGNPPRPRSSAKPSSSAVPTSRSPWPCATPGKTGLTTALRMARDCLPHLSARMTGLR